MTFTSTTSTGPSEAVSRGRPERLCLPVGPVGNKVSELCSLKNSFSNRTRRVCSVGFPWIHDGSSLAIGTSSGLCHVWDVTKAKRIRTFINKSKCRIVSSSWNKHLLGFGSNEVEVHDVRQMDSMISLPWKTKVRRVGFPGTRKEQSWR